MATCLEPPSCLELQLIGFTNISTPENCNWTCCKKKKNFFFKILEILVLFCEKLQTENAAPSIVRRNQSQ